MSIYNEQIKGLPYGLSWNIWHKFAMYQGLKGIAFYSIDKNKEGYYDVIFCRPSGKGVRKGIVKEWTYVERLATRRKSKKSAMDRAYKLAYGRSRHPVEAKKLVKDNPAHTAYCLKQKKWVLVKAWQEEVTVNFRTYLTSKCPECDTKVSKLGKLMDCPECGKKEPGKKDDYICQPCREKESREAVENTTTKS